MKKIMITFTSIFKNALKYLGQAYFYTYFSIKNESANVEQNRYTFFLKVFTKYTLFYLCVSIYYQTFNIQYTTFM